MSEADVTVVTTDEVAGKRITGQLGVVGGFAHANVFDMKSYKEAFRQALTELEANAAALGANAVVGARTDEAVSHEKHVGVVAFGTAVTAEDA